MYLVPPSPGTVLIGGSDGMKDKTDKKSAPMEDRKNKKGSQQGWRVYDEDLRGKACQVIKLSDTLPSCI